MPNKEWTDYEVQEEIDKAVQIVRADKIDALIRMRLSSKSDNEDGDKNNPPPSRGSDSNPPAKRKSLWWGTEE